MPAPELQRPLVWRRKGGLRSRDFWRAVRGQALDIRLVDVLERRTDAPLRRYRAGEDVALHRVSASASDWRRLIPSWRWPIVQEAFARGDHGFVATVEEEFAGWVWVSRTSHRDNWSGLGLRLASDEAYSYGMEVPEQFRTRGVAAALMGAILAEAAADPSLSRVYGWVDRQNKNSQLLLRTLFGFRQVQVVRRLRVLGSVGWGLQVPRSDEPPFGPVSRRGRHDGA